MWRTLSIDAEGTLRGEDGAMIRFREPAEIARAIARSADRPVVETRLRTGERVAVAIEPGRAHLLRLPDRDDLDVERLAKIVSHDVRAPLRAIEAYSSFLAEDAGSLPENALDDLERLRSATARLRAYLDGLVDYLRAPRRATGASCALADVTRQVVERFEPAFKARGGSISVEHEPRLDPSNVRLGVAPAALEEQLARVIENIIVHVPPPTPPHARLSLGVAAPDRVRIDVADDGPGLEPEERSRVLELFRRRGARQPGDDRAGAGLAIVKRAVEAWGGDLHLDAAPEGGVLVRLELPARGDGVGGEGTGRASAA